MSRLKLARFLNLLWVLMLVLSACAAPQTAPAPAAPAAQPAKEAQPTPEPAKLKSIVDILYEDGSLTALVQALEKTGLVDKLKGEGPFTIFAPTNDAFGKLPEGTTDALLQDTDTHLQILLYHVVEGKVTVTEVAEKLKPAQTSQEQTATTAVKTLQDESVTIAFHGGTVKVNNANILKSDIEASNGVIHIIDTVLMPVAPPEPPPPSDLMKGIEVWEPYRRGGPLPIGDAELVPGYPLMRAGVARLGDSLFKYQVQINTARTVRLEEGGSTTYLAPSGSIPNPDELPKRAQDPGVIVGTLVLEGETELKPGEPYAVHLRSAGQDEWYIDLIDARGEVVWKLEKIIYIAGLDTGEMPSAAIFYGTRYCRTDSVCWPCSPIYWPIFPDYPTLEACQNSMRRR